MPEAYVIANTEVHDEEAYERYRAQVLPTVEKHGGTFMVRGGRWERLEGDDPLPRLVILKFPSYEAAKAWYYSDEYQPLAELRQSASKGNLVLVEGAE